jgi:aminobenzoyl-glutamate utilization protein B
VALLAAAGITPHVGAATDNPHKDIVIASVDAQAEALANLSDEIWRNAEIAFREHKSSDALVAHAERHGFRVTRGTGDIPTAFVAEYGSGRPIIGIMG